MSKSASTIRRVVACGISCNGAPRSPAFNVHSTIEPIKKLHTDQDQAIASFPKQYEVFLCDGVP
ncbi:hypothetical protein [Acetobacter papayae]|uniref:hypothetical protein n=1 Tax=Acetobacter papayae TaxID=1076592 RepID=UPI000471D592|nr:hypothetical protein [Acetobacter papayae]